MHKTVSLIFTDDMGYSQSEDHASVEEAVREAEQYGIEDYTIVDADTGAVLR